MPRGPAIPQPEVDAAMILLDQGWHIADVVRVLKRNRESLMMRVRRERRKATPLDDWRTGYRTQEIKDAVERGE